MEKITAASDALASLLWVIPSDQLLQPAGSLQIGARMLGFEAWQLHGGSALAIDVYGPCRAHGRPVDYPDFLA
jgi:hypothetical protein